MSKQLTPKNTQTHADASFDAWMGNPNIPGAMRESFKEVFTRGWNAALEVAELEAWRMRDDWENPASLSPEKAKAAEEIGKVMRGLIKAQSPTPTASKNAVAAGTPIVKSDGTTVPVENLTVGGLLAEHHQITKIVKQTGPKGRPVNRMGECVGHTR